MSNNVITLVGRVGSDIELTTTPKGKKVAKLSLGVKERAPEADDDDDTTTMWVAIELWNGLADRATEFITKGREIVVTGRLVLQRYKKSVGKNEFTMTKALVRAYNFHLCSPKPVVAEPAESANATDDSDEPAESESSSSQLAC